jgi:uncharacterized protein with beta-barrel porin domain
MGLAYHYDNTRLAYNTAGDSAKVEGHQVAVYAQYQSGDWRFKGIVGYGRNQYATQRSIVIGNDVSRAAGDYNGDELGLHAEASYRIDRGSYVFEPLVSLQGTLLRQDAFSETGAGALGLNASAQTSRSAVSMVGARWHLPCAKMASCRASCAHSGAINGWMPAVASMPPSRARRASTSRSPACNRRDGLVLGAGLSGKLGQASRLVPGLQPGPERPADPARRGGGLALSLVTPWAAVRILRTGSRSAARRPTPWARATPSSAWPDSSAASPRALACRH